MAVSTMRQLVTFGKVAEDGTRWTVEVSPSLSYEQAISHARVMLRAYLVREGPLPDVRLASYYIGASTLRADVMA